MSESSDNIKPKRRREAALFEAASQLNSADRAAFLQNACHNDPMLLQRVNALLAAHDTKDSFLEPEAAPPATKSAKTLKVDVEEDFASDAVGMMVGRYKLMEKIGEGGCGVVYVAEQLVPVRRRVALKVIKLGMDTRQVVARFEAERQALAMMDHPNIAKVLDAGTTEAGRPYFVMELVRGIRITEYCDQSNLTTRERLDLFIKVCQAIQHAHQKGIIHRDIKPSNILVTLHDGVPVPKVIDFGIAKATEGRLTDATVYTQLNQFMGTPAYMSPEQAEMSGLDIDTRSDIYSLGVLLYELLAGSTPFDAKELVALGIDAMRKTIREKEPMRPSTRFATLRGEELTTAARRRSADTAKLIHQLQGDLDWIVMKCLEKDRTRRYETANGLAADLKRHLNNEPVVARPPSASYRIQKAFRRNKLAFTLGIAVVLALVAGLNLAALGWRQTRIERDKSRAAQASEEAQRIAAQASEQKARMAEAGQKSLREQAEAEALTARRIAYSSDMNLVQQALAVNNLGRAQRLLDRQRPQPGQVDLRGWEWRYLWSQTRDDEHDVFFTGPNRILHPLSFSGDGRLLARTDGDGGGITVVTDLISRRVVWQRTNSWRPVFAHHGAVLAFAEPASLTNDAITILDLSSGKQTQIPTPWDATYWIGFTPDDRRLLTVSDHGDWRYVMAWDVETRQQLWQHTITEPNATYDGRHFAISSDGLGFAAAVSGGQVEVLETKDGSERFTIKTTDDIALTVGFSPDNTTLLTGAGFTDPIIRLWDARNGKAAGSLEGHRAWVSDLLFTPDGNTLISSSADETIRLWDWPTRRTTGVLRGHLNEVDGLALASDGRTLASRCKDGSIYLWDVTKAPRRLGYQKLPCRLNPRLFEFTPDSRSILGVGFNSRVALWDAGTLQETRRLWATNHSDTVLSPTASQVVRTDPDGFVHRLDVRTGVATTTSIIVTNVDDWGFTDDGKTFVTVHENVTGDVFDFWASDTWTRKRSLRTQLGNVAILPNAVVLVAKPGFRFVDVTTPEEAWKQIKRVGSFPFGGLAISPNSRIFAGAFNDGSIRLWNMTTLQPMDPLKGFLLSAHSVTFSPDGTRLAAGSSGQEAVKFWDTTTWQEVLTLSGEGSVFFGVKFSPDGRYLLAVNLAGTALLWSAPTWQELEMAEAADQRAQQP